VFNVFYLEELSRWIDEQNFDFVYWNMLHEIWYNSIASLHPAVKLKAEARLTLVSKHNKHKKDFQNIINFMANSKGWANEELLDSIRKHDILRNENLWDHHPELAEAIGYERT